MSVGNTTFVEDTSGVLELELMGSADSLEITGIARQAFNSNPTPEKRIKTSRNFQYFQYFLDDFI